MMEGWNIGFGVMYILHNRNNGILGLVLSI